MLSGGERALTGVALLFAMLSVNPVPFCILDEVDAALDEANIGRFADALRRLSEDIDFVVITHNRATIEVADTIYGVTMDDAAVSAARQPAAGRHSCRGGHRMMPRPAREPTGMGLRPRSGGLGARLRSLFSGGTASAEAWDDVEEALIAADIGPGGRPGAGRRGSRPIGRPRRRPPCRPWPTVLRERLEATARPFELGPAPSVILVVGVNGTGKTTTIAKLASRLARDGHSVILAAARHLPCGGHRAAAPVGRPAGAAGRRAASGRGSRSGRLRRDRRRRVTRQRRR